MYAIRTILYPTDFSEEAAAAFPVACSLAKQHGALLVILHVIPPPITWGEAIAQLPPDDYEVQIKNEYLLPLRPTDKDIRYEHHLERGNPEELIDSVAEEIGADLIVMGTHGRSGVGRLLMGSICEQVLRTAPCPVLAVRKELPERAEARKGKEARETTAAGK